MKLTSGTTLDNLAIPNSKNLSQFYGSGGQMHKKAKGGMVSDYMMDQMALPVLKGPPQSRDAPASLKPVLFAKKAKGGKVSKLKRGGRPTKL